MSEINSLELKQIATKNVTDILNICIKHNTQNIPHLENGQAGLSKALVIFDTDYELTNILTSAYREALPEANFLEFKTRLESEEEKENQKRNIIETFDKLSEGDLVVLVQSTNFLLNDFRIRLHLFNQGLKVVEHMHLARNSENQWGTYVNALAYDTNWYPAIAPKLKSKLDSSTILELVSSDAKLTVNGELEPAKLNIGDYSGMASVGGTFPIGEVFTESKVFENLNGEVYIYAYAGEDFNINMHEPFKIKIENGQVTSWADNTPQSFINIINLVKEYERPLIREIGFGLNRAISKDKPLNDITAFERILGMHLSLGEKHSVYKKEGLATKKTKFHIDLFPVVDYATVNGEKIFENGKYFL